MRADGWAARIGVRPSSGDPLSKNAGIGVRDFLGGPSPDWRGDRLEQPPRSPECPGAPPIPPPSSHPLDTPPAYHLVVRGGVALQSGDPLSKNAAADATRRRRAGPEESCRPGTARCDLR